jgi:hypothetical protein
MRRSIIGAAAVAVTGLVGIIPAQAQEAPVNVIITEGIGRVCGAADLRTAAERTAYGNNKPNVTGKQAWCTYPGAGYDAPVNPGQTTHPNWWVSGRADGSKFQGLFAPGVGPGANGPYSLEILQQTTTPPSNVCIDSIEGPGCGTRLVGRLTPAPTNGFGAHAGSSQGVGVFTFSSATGAVQNSGRLGWENSAATILPLSGAVTAGDGAGNSIIGFSSSRGVTGDANAGNAGVTAPTTGFQTEGIIVQY